MLIFNIIYPWLCWPTSKLMYKPRAITTSNRNLRNNLLPLVQIFPAKLSPTSPGHFSSATISAGRLTCAFSPASSCRSSWWQCRVQVASQIHWFPYQHCQHWIGTFGVHFGHFLGGQHLKAVLQFSFLLPDCSLHTPGPEWCEWLCTSLLTHGICFVSWHIRGLFRLGLH